MESFILNIWADYMIILKNYHFDSVSSDLFPGDSDVDAYLKKVDVGDQNGQNRHQLMMLSPT